MWSMTSTVFDTVDAHTSTHWATTSRSEGAAASVHRRDVYVMGAHGGAGATTIATWLGLPELSSAISAQPAGLLVTARTNARGLTAAREVAAELAFRPPDGVELIALALVADAPGRLPKALENFAHVVAGGAPAHVRLPWVDALRLGTEFNPERARTVSRALFVLRHLIEAAAHEKPQPPTQPTRLTNRIGGNE